MPDSKHSIYRSRLLAVIFLFLNAVCIASPGIKNSADNYNQVALQAGQDINAFESEESVVPAASFISQVRRGSLSATDDIYKHNFSCALALPVDKWSHPAIAQSAFLQKPGYYTFLFRYTLF